VWRGGLVWKLWTIILFIDTSLCDDDMELINDAVIYNIIAHIILVYNITKLIVDVRFDKNRWADINLNVSCILYFWYDRNSTSDPSMAKLTSGYSD